MLWAAGWCALIFTLLWTVANEHWLWLLASVIWARFISIFGVQIALHRFYAHRSFITGTWRRRFLLIASLLPGEGNPVAWATHHRHHHRHTDGSLDPHSPLESIWNSAIFWPIRSSHWWQQDKQITLAARDLLKDPEVRWLAQNYYSIWFCLCLLAVLIDWRLVVCVLLAGIGWAQAAAILVNTCGHLKMPGSYRNHDTPDNSYNNAWIQWLIQGEGLHNNHHQSPTDYDQSYRPGEFDFSGWLCRRFFVVQPL